MADKTINGWRRTNPKLNWWTRGVYDVFIVKMNGLYYVRVSENGFLIDSLAESNKQRALKAVRMYMETH